jgi:hypothetical protein
MAKVFVSAVAMWDSWQFGGPRISVSVESENGQPVTNLTKKHFTVGFIGSSGSGAWIEQKITSVESTGSQHGFYTLFIGNYTLGTYSLNWGDHNADSIFTVEVHGEAQKGQGDQGRTVVINTPTTYV